MQQYRHDRLSNLITIYLTILGNIIVYNFFITINNLLLSGDYTIVMTVEKN